MGKVVMVSAATAATVVEVVVRWCCGGMWQRLGGVGWRGGEWYSGSYRSDDEEKIWDLAGKTHRKLFRRRPTVAGGGAVVAAGNGGERSDEDMCYVFVKNE
ncbi:hypothetical protein Tco_1111222 [Tanacetum coccineum]|uniref:Uncharacterized protein n=1 Tax=Tanacetum coccineum TaxID=301880 RepID=A0ABQ5INQ8_9ASTR